MEIHKEKIDAAARAKEISEVIFHNNDDIKFMRFLSNEYEQMLQETAPGKLRFFKRDRERDIAILSLILDTGLRVSEAASLTISSINFRTRYIKVIRKGDKKSSILATQTALDDVQEYLKVRANRYKCLNDEDILFVTNYKGSYAQISVNAIQNLQRNILEHLTKKRALTSCVIHMRLIIITKIKIWFCWQIKWGIIRWKLHLFIRILMILNVN